jgi:uncharacterized membrane protein YkoI
MTKYLTGSLAALAIALVLPVSSQAEETNDAAILAKAGVSLSEAISAAEQSAGGKAVKAELEKSKGGLAYDVEVVAGNKVVDVKVDPANAKVLRTDEDKADQDDGEDAED